MLIDSPMLIDSHCHLDYLERDGADIGEILTQAKDAGVQSCITIGTKWQERSKQLDLADRFPSIFCTLGTHPHEAASQTMPTLDEFVAALNHPKAIGVGETGLDYYYNHSPKQAQIDSFNLHIEVARATKLPIIIHCRDADDEMADILRSAYDEAPFTGLIHCFSGTQALADAALSIGMSLSISGIVTFKKADSLRDIVKNTPLDRLLVETDSPYLAPIPYRGKSNQPAYVYHTAKAVAELKQISIDELAAATTQNCRTLFKKAVF